jgi:hypothetical protein
MHSAKETSTQLRKKPSGAITQQVGFQDNDWASSEGRIWNPGLEKGAVTFQIIGQPSPLWEQILAMIRSMAAYLWPS